MSWWQLTLRVESQHVPEAEALLALAGAVSWSIHDAGDAPVLEPEPGQTPLWPQVLVRALFERTSDIDAIASWIGAAVGGHGVDIELLEDADWLEAGRGHAVTRRFGDLELLPAGAEATAPRAVRLHMGLAFGTGEHATTALCLEWLAEHVAPGDRLLDYGCGSGVLALAALRLGARFAWAVDDDPQALRATTDNARLNALATLWIGAPEALPEISVDIVAANILAGPLQALAPRFASLSVAGGHIVLSGILESQAEQVRAAYAADFADFELAARDGWVRLTAVRSSDP